MKEFDFSFKYGQHFIDPVTGAALIKGGAAVLGAFGNVLGTSSSNKTNLQIHREQMEQQQRQFETQLAYNDKAWERERSAALEDFDMENRYNSPAAQRARFEAAGLNPALMMGDSSAIGQMESTSSPTAPSPSGMPSSPNLGVPDYGQFATAIGDAFSEYQQGRIRDEQIQQLGVETEFKRLQLESDLTEQWYRIDKMIKDGHLSDAERQLAITRRDEIRQRMKHLDELHTYDVQQRREDARFSVAAANEQEAKAAIAKIDEKYRAKLHEANLRVSDSQVRLASKQIWEIGQNVSEMIKMNNASRHEIASRIQLNGEQRRYISKQAAKVVRETYNLDPKSPVGKKQMELIESQIYDNLRLSLPFGMKVSHPITWFNYD